MRFPFSLLIAVIFHAGLFGIAMQAAGPSRPHDVSNTIEVDFVVAKPDSVADPTPSVADARVTRAAQRSAGRPARARPKPPAVPGGPSSLAGTSEIAVPSDRQEPIESPKPASIVVENTPTPAPAVQSAGPVVVATPRYRSNPKPEYPIACLRRHEEGVVMLNVQVEVDGRPSAVFLKLSSGYPLLDQAAIEAVRQWTFEPARAGGIPVSSLVLVPIRFSVGEP